MTPYGNLLILAVVVLVQTTIMPAAALGPVKPFLPLLVTVSWTLLRGPVPGLWWAIGLGLMLDAVSPSMHNFYTLPLVAAAGATALGRARLFPNHIVIPWVLVAVATVVYVLAQRMLVPLAGGALTWSADALTRTIVPEMVLNLLWLPVAYFPLRSLAKGLGGPRIEWER